MNVKIPEIGLGTWDLYGKECSKLVQLALQMGYRHIDTAHIYDNHAAVRKGIGNFDRSQLFITSKIFLEKQLHLPNVEESVEEACDLALKELGIDYLDLYLIHWPVEGMPMTKVFQAMENLQRKGKILQVGVSNFTIHHLEDLRQAQCYPTVNQVEFHPYLYQKDLLEYCNTHKIQIVAYRPFGMGALLHDPLLEKIGLAHQKTPSQVILRWLMQKNIIAIPKSSSENHLKENLDLSDFSLHKAEIEQIDALNKNQRFCMPESTVFNY